LVAPILIDTGLILSRCLWSVATSSRTNSTDFQQYRNNWSSRLWHYFDWLPLVKTNGQKQLKK
ncbi:hypothetical protein, partial [Flavobacterium psychrophilum]|uniref:hypothetical protein n=1 Tax=Flavobacterium psychrophilum TaxID=96345 RepID=UPI001ABC84EF